MQLTKTSLSFELFILALGGAFLCMSSAGEKVVFPYLAQMLGRVKKALNISPKERKTYKVVQEQLRV